MLAPRGSPGRYPPGCNFNRASSRNCRQVRRPSGSASTRLKGGSTPLRLRILWGLQSHRLWRAWPLDRKPAWIALVLHWCTRSNGSAERTSVFTDGRRPAGGVAAAAVRKQFLSGSTSSQGSVDAAGRLPSKAKPAPVSQPRLPAPLVRRAIKMFIIELKADRRCCWRTAGFGVPPYGRAIHVFPWGSTTGGSVGFVFLRWRRPPVEWISHRCLRAPVADPVRIACSLMLGVAILVAIIGVTRRAPRRFRTCQAGSFQRFQWGAC